MFYNGTFFGTEYAWKMKRNRYEVELYVNRVPITVAQLGDSSSSHLYCPSESSKIDINLKVFDKISRKFI